jgi:hypothetical protein
MDKEWKTLAKNPFVISSTPPYPTLWAYPSAAENK